MTSEEQQKPENRARPTTDEFRAFVAEDWAPRPPVAQGPTEAARYAAERRDARQRRLPGRAPRHPRRRAQGAQQRHRLRLPSAQRLRAPHRPRRRPRAGRRARPRAARRRQPRGGPLLPPDGRPRHRRVLRRHPLRRVLGRRQRRRSRTSRPSSGSARATSTSSPTRWPRTPARWWCGWSATPTATSPAQLDEARASEGAVQEDLTERDDELAHFLSVLRLTKDEWEVEQMRQAVAATHTGFEAVIADLPEAVRQRSWRALGRGRLRPHGPPRGQRRRLRLDLRLRRPRHHAALDPATPATSRDGDLLLLDAGVEVESLFTADITRTLPVDGTFTEAQREIYDAVLAAQEAGLAAVKPGNKFSDVHAAAIRVIAEHLHAWGLLPDGVSRRRHPRHGPRPVPPALDGARHEPPPRHRRPRLRPGDPRGVHGRRAASRA